MRKKKGRRRRKIGCQMICEERRKVEEEEEDDDVEMWWMKLKCWLLPLRLSTLELSKRKSLMTNDCRLSNTALECDINKAIYNCQIF